ncbi:ABC transporter permease subunit [Thermofilum pendens]|uniref:Binding-protein-dependent transport systems inner membrane component n=1 Tax=Thermofilum pendens (strain DSM 2475 / Hrk 5) TaxID=368408 RepID=A1RW43_THEPD|nr:ABC transporter permease subunit [Thermofilum pendens]ABL77423.1 binding-protein-dependent transport systems inner membrane component [Thermofilum pendens Hrk 5]
MLALLIAVSASLARMAEAYIVSLLIALVLGSLMARNKVVESIMLPVLDILQSIPILGFFPAALAMFIANLPRALGVEAAAVFLIVTSLVWNMIFGVYASIKSLEPSVFDMARVYSLGAVSRFFYIYVPASRAALLANSLISWAGGWFFLTAAEVITLGEEEYKLTGIGAFIMESYNRGDYASFYIGVAALFATIMATYVLLWNPAVKSVRDLPLPSVSAFYEKFSEVVSRVWSGLGEALVWVEARVKLPGFVPRVVGATLLVVALFYLGSGVAGLLSLDVVGVAKSFLHELPLSLARVSIVLVFSLVLSLLIAYLTYSFRRAAMLIGASGELLASVPAIIWWPLLGYVALTFSWGPLVVLFTVLLQGSLWYLYFNILVFGLGSIRKEHEELAAVYGVKGWHFFRSIFFPSVFPSLLTGALSSWGGAWNATIAAEYVTLGQRTIDLGGVGALLNRYTVEGEAGKTALAALFLSLVIVAVDKAVWARLFSRLSGKFAGE